MTETSSSTAERRRWLAVLARSPREPLEQALALAQPLPPSENVRQAECGMVMVRARIGGTGNAFHLGEATVTRCAVRAGGTLGVGYTLGRDERKAELIAVFDALLQDEARRPRLLAALIDPLERAQREARDGEAAAVASSRVEFFTMVRGDA